MSGDKDEPDRVAGLIEERRMVHVAFEESKLLDLITGRAKCQLADDMPLDAVVVGAQFDPSSASVLVRVVHESFHPTHVGLQLPMFGQMLVWYE